MKKQAKSGFFKIGNINVAAGERKFGKIGSIELSDQTKVNIPLMILKGVKTGPSLLLISTIHGPEILGIEIIRRIVREEVDPKNLSGTVLAIPVANPLAYQQSSYVTPHYDFFDLNRSFPGDPHGTTTSRIAGLIWSVASKANYIIDIHGLPNAMEPGFVIVRPVGKDDIDKKAMQLANTYGLTVTLAERVRIEEKGRLPGLQALAGTNGIPCILVETSGWRVWSKNAADSGVKGILNVMKFLKMIKGTPIKQKGIVSNRPLKTYMLIANRGGMLHPEARPGEYVAAGSVVARIVDVFGEDIEVLKSPKNGYVCAYPFMYNQAVSTGDYVALIGEQI